MSTILPGSSINFDGVDLQHREEEERRRDDIQQEKELHDLLCAELPEDLLNDNSYGSGHSRQEIDRSFGSGQEGWQDAQSSPVTTQFHDGQPAYFNQKFQYQIPVTSYPTTKLSREYTDAEKWQMQQQKQYKFNNEPSFTPKSLSAPNNVIGSYGYKSTSVPQQSDNSYNNNANRFRHSPSESDVYSFAERREAEGSEDFDSFPLQDRYDERLSHTLPTDHDDNEGKEVRFNTSAAISAPTSPYSPQYRNYHLHRPPSRHQPPPPTAPTTQHDATPVKLTDDPDKFNSSEGGAGGRELTQLRVLYEARGKQLDKVTRQLEAAEAERERDKRIVNHQLAMVKDEKVGMGNSLEECQHLLVEKEHQLAEKEALCATLTIDVESIKQAKLEMVKQMEVSERTIENLKQELVSLQRCDTLDRARQQHDAMVAATKERHERDMLEVTQLLDEARQTADTKTDECEKLKVRLKSALKESEDVLLEKTDTINRLSRNLEDAQKQCQNLLADSGEVAYLQMQVNQLTKVNSETEAKYKGYEANMRELQDQVDAYSKALRLGVTSSHHHDHMNDSYADLMGISDSNRGFDWDENTSQDGADLVSSLRKELERALLTNKEKREKVRDLNAKTKELSDECGHWRARVDELEGQLVAKQTPNVRRLRGGGVSDELEELEERLRAALERSERADGVVDELEETCRDLKQQMLDMVEQHDHHKQEAVDRCERALMQLHEDAKQVLRDEMLAEHEQKMYELSIEHDANIDQLHTEKVELAKELSEVKQSYVHVCAEKDEIELKMSHHLEQKMKEREEEFENEKKSMLEKLLDKEKGKSDDEIQELIKNKLAVEKMKWLEDVEILKEEAAKKAINRHETDFQHRMEKLREEIEVKHQTNVADILLEEKEKWNAEKEREMRSRLDELYAEMKEEEQSSVTTALSIAQLNWIAEHQKNDEAAMEQKVTAALSDAKRSWLDEQEEKINAAVEEATAGLRRQIEELKSQEKGNDEKREKEKDESMKKEKEMSEQLRSMQQRHEKEFESFTSQHKRTLQQFLSNERKRSNSKDADVRSTWSAARDQLVRDHQKELESMREAHELRCRDQHVEIERLSAACDVIATSQQHANGDAVRELERRHGKEMERIKHRMKEEYRRWKREKKDLQDKIKQLTCSHAPSSGHDHRAVFLQMQEIYFNALASIKSEMFRFIRQGRTRTVTVIQRAANKERKRIVDTFRSRSREKGSRSREKGSRSREKKGSRSREKASRSREKGSCDKQKVSSVEDNRDAAVAVGNNRNGVESRPRDVTDTVTTTTSSSSRNLLTRSSVNHRLADDAHLRTSYRATERDWRGARGRSREKRCKS